MWPGRVTNKSRWRGVRDLVGAEVLPAFPREDVPWDDLEGSGDTG